MQHYLERAAANFGVPFPELTSEAVQLLVSYGWPGNIRELRNVAERLALRDARRPLRADDLPIELRGGSVSPVALPVVEPAGGVQELPAASVHPSISRAADELWRRMANGEDFWSVVHKAYKARELARQDLASIIDRGLQETRGSYRALLKVFHLPSTDYKRFHAFLYQQRCNLPVAAYRRRVPRTTPGASASRVLASTSGREFGNRVTG
jgi:DNA-binding NtrC family response regulator